MKIYCIQNTKEEFEKIKQINPHIKGNRWGMLIHLDSNPKIYDGLDKISNEKEYIDKGYIKTTIDNYIKEYNILYKQYLKELYEL